MRQMKGKKCSEQVLEVVTPRTNTARLSPAEHLFASLVLRSGRADGEPVALEIAADVERRRFFVRTGSPRSSSGASPVSSGLRTRRPVSSIRRCQFPPTGDPDRLGPDEQVVAAVLRLRMGEHLPLRTLDDRNLDPTTGSAQADPLLGVLGALTDLPPAWRSVAQLVVFGPAPVDWARAYQRLALERPLDQERARDTGPSLALPLGLLALVGLYLVVSSGAAAWARGDWLSTFGLVGGTLTLACIAVLIARWLGRRELVDPKLVQVKLGRDACQVELRLAVFAPAFVDPTELAARLDRLAAAYRPFSLASGNSLLPRHCPRRRRLARSPTAPPSMPAECAGAGWTLAPRAGRGRRSVPGAHYRPKTATTPLHGRPQHGG